jgi:hypothetical protein
MSEVVKAYEPTIAAMEATADRLAGHGIQGLTAEDWPVLRAVLEDYIAIRRSVADWDKNVARAVVAVAPDDRA